MKRITQLETVKQKIVLSAEVVFGHFTYFLSLLLSPCHRWTDTQSIVSSPTSCEPGKKVRGRTSGKPKK